MSVPPPAAAVAACSRRGTSTGKSVNEDSYLVYLLEDERTWLLAVADGVTNSKFGWWASDGCMELLWGTVAQYGPLARGEAFGPADMQDWLGAVREQYLLRHLPEAVQLARSNPTSTLTFAVVVGRTAHYAHCGDTRLYVADPADGYDLRAVIEHKVIERTQKKDGKLTCHIATEPKHWTPVCGAAEVPAGGLLVLCSDGMIGGDGALVGKKFAALSQSLAQPGDLQDRVTAAVARVAALGEADDLTLVAFQPGGP